MNSIDLNPENILPHRDRMLLVDSIIEVDDNGAVTRSVVTEKVAVFRRPKRAIHRTDRAGGSNSRDSQRMDTGKKIRPDSR